MTIAKFDFCKKSASITLSGTNYKSSNLEKLLNLLLKCDKEKLSEIKIIGDFNSKLIIKELKEKNKISELNKMLLLFQKITKTIEESNTVFTAILNNKVRGPALEFALACNFIKANIKTIFKFDELDNGFMPLFGSLQRIIRLIDYKKALEIILIRKSITFLEAKDLKLVNFKKNNSEIIKQKKILWDKNFTDTFIYYNTKIHSMKKRNFSAYRAVLSSIFEGSICDYQAALSIEKKWCTWLLSQKYLKI